MPADVAVVFYRILGIGLEDAVKQSEIAPLRNITVLLSTCDGDELMAVAHELGQVAAKRQLEGDEGISAFLAISQMIGALDPKDLPRLLHRIGKYVETDMETKLIQDVEKDTDDRKPEEE